MATLDGIVTGYLISKTIKTWGLAAVCTTYDISIDPNHRRTGIGLGLLADLETRETTTGTLIANIWPNNTASLALFQTMGYELHPDASRPYQNAFKTQSVPLKHQPLALLPYIFRWLYTRAILFAEKTILRIRHKTS